MATVFEVQGSKDKGGKEVKKLEVITDSDWAGDQVTWKSASGAAIMAEGMWLHAHSRGQSKESGVEQLRGGGGRSVGGIKDACVVAGDVDVRRLGALRH